MEPVDEEGKDSMGGVCPYDTIDEQDTSMSKPYNYGMGICSAYPFKVSETMDFRASASSEVSQTENITLSLPYRQTKERAMEPVDKEGEDSMGGVCTNDSADEQDTGMSPAKPDDSRKSWLQRGDLFRRHQHTSIQAAKDYSFRRQRKLSIRLPRDFFMEEAKNDLSMRQLIASIQAAEDEERQLLASRQAAEDDKRQLLASIQAAKNDFFRMRQLLVTDWDILREDLDILGKVLDMFGEMCDEKGYIPCRQYVLRNKEELQSQKTVDDMVMSKSRQGKRGIVKNGFLQEKIKNILDEIADAFNKPSGSLYSSPSIEGDFIFSGIYVALKMGPFYRSCFKYSLLLYGVFNKLPDIRNLLSIRLVRFKGNTIPAIQESLKTKRQKGKGEGIPPDGLGLGQHGRETCCPKQNTTSLVSFGRLFLSLFSFFGKANSGISCVYFCIIILSMSSPSDAATSGDRKMLQLQPQHISSSEMILLLRNSDEMCLFSEAGAKFQNGTWSPLLLCDILEYKYFVYGIEMPVGESNVYDTVCDYEVVYQAMFCELIVVVIILATGMLYMYIRRNNSSLEVKKAYVAIGILTVCVWTVISKRKTSVDSQITEGFSVDKTFEVCGVLLQIFWCMTETESKQDKLVTSAVKLTVPRFSILVVASFQTADNEPSSNPLLEQDETFPIESLPTGMDIKQQSPCFHGQINRVKYAHVPNVVNSKQEPVNNSYLSMKNSLPSSGWHGLETPSRKTRGKNKEAERRFFTAKELYFALAILLLGLLGCGYAGLMLVKRPPEIQTVSQSSDHDVEVTIDCGKESDIMCSCAQMEPPLIDAICLRSKQGKLTEKDIENERKFQEHLNMIDIVYNNEAEDIETESISEGIEDVLLHRHEKKKTFSFTEDEEAFLSPLSQKMLQLEVDEKERELKTIDDDIQDTSFFQNERRIGSKNDGEIDLLLPNEALGSSIPLPQSTQKSFERESKRIGMIVLTNRALRPRDDKTSTKRGFKNLKLNVKADDMPSRKIDHIVNEDKFIMLKELRHETWLPLNELPQPKIDPIIVAHLRTFEPIMAIIDQIASGTPPTPHVSMRYELLRFCTLRSYPKENKPFLVKLAEAGFYYASDGDGVVCYCCGVRRYNWTAEDNPMKIHARINPQCKFLKKNEENNVPVQYFGPFSKELTFIMNIPEPRQREELGEDVNNDWAPGRIRSPAPRPQSREEESHANALGINTAIPKYTQYATKTARENSFIGSWPASATHTPQELADAGFFYAKFGDCVRCFYCGIGLRHWAKDDNPWIEHSRWSRNCVYVKQKKGEEFVNLVQMAGQYSHLNETANTNAGSQEFLQRVEQLFLGEAAISVLEMGYQPTLVKKAIEQVLRNYGNGRITAQMLMEKVLEIEQSEKQTQTPPAATAKAATKTPAQSSKSETAKSEEATSEAKSVEGAQAPAKQEKREGSGPKSSDSAKATSEDNDLKSQDPKVIKAENEQLKEQTLCKVCLDNTVCIVFLPCGHLVTCADCAPAMRKCPICRALVKGTVRTYMS